MRGVWAGSPLAPAYLDGLQRLGFHRHGVNSIIQDVARTIADLGSLDALAAKHVAEAVQYRSLDRTYWS